MGLNGNTHDLPEVGQTWVLTLARPTRWRQIELVSDHDAERCIVLVLAVEADKGVVAIARLGRYGQLADTEFVHWPSAKVGLDDDAGNDSEIPNSSPGGERR